MYGSIKSFRTYNVVRIIKRKEYDMARCKCKKSGCCTKIVSDIVSNMPNGCFDVCTNPICGSPSELSLFAPLIYDQIGINLCAVAAAGVDISANYPTVTNAAASVVEISYQYGAGNVVINQIPGRPNCYSVKLSNLQVTFALNLYDENCRLVATIYPTVEYLPSDTTAATYYEDVNPSSVELEIFAPYGVSYNREGESFQPALNYTGFLSGDNGITQGLNLYAIPKVLDIDIASDEVTIGLSVILQSLYYAGYRVASAGKIVTPKGSIVSQENSDEMKFVCGNLLNLAIKPLDLSPPHCESSLKNDCDKGCQPECEENLPQCPTCSI